jgi:hypothetical protein
VSYLSSHRQDWRGQQSFAALFAGVAGAATTFAGVGLLLAATAWSGLADTHDPWGYRLGMGLTLMIEMVGALVPAGAVCAIGVAIFGVPVAHWLGGRAAGGWGGALALVWGAVAGGVFGVGLFGWVFAGEAEWPVFFGLGAAFGVPTGVWFWFFNRRAWGWRAAMAD